MARKKKDELFFVREMSDDYQVDLDTSIHIPKRVFDKAMKSKDPAKVMREYVEKKKHKKAA